MRFKVKFNLKNLSKLVPHRMRERYLPYIRDSLIHILTEMAYDMNEELQRRRYPGASPPQSARRNPAWIHTPIEEGWNIPNPEIKKTKVIATLYNASEHLLAVEFGTLHVAPIFPRTKPFLVFDSLKSDTGIVRAPYVSGQKGKGFIEAVFNEWTRKGIEEYLAR